MRQGSGIQATSWLDMQGKIFVLTIFALLLGPAVFCGAPASARETFRLEHELRRASRVRKYSPASSQQLELCEQLFFSSLRRPLDASLTQDWKQLGFNAVAATHPTSGEPITVIFESLADARGWGFYVIYPNRVPGIVLQAPHSFADQFTRNVALRMDRDGEFAAVAWNTINRKQVDVAHEIRHPFSAFTRALVRSHPGAFVIQVHGFAQQKRSSAAGATADLIISNGTRSPERFVRKTAVLMQSNIEFGETHLFPISVQELGATTNVQAELLRQNGSRRFMHFEMSRPLRTRLVVNQRIRDSFLSTLTDAIK